MTRPPYAGAPGAIRPTLAEPLIPGLYPDRLVEQIAASRYGKHAFLFGTDYDWPTRYIQSAWFFNGLCGRTGQHRSAS